MIKENILVAILESIIDPIVFVDSEHIIRYINKVAKQKYGKRGHLEIEGKSIFDYHNEGSKQIILEIFETFKAGEDERFLVINSVNQKVYMRAVRDSQGNLIGYYERYEKVRKMGS